MTGIINNMFRPHKASQKTRIKLHNKLFLPALLYGSENWTIKARDARITTVAKTKYKRRAAGEIWTDYNTDIEIVEELNVTLILGKIRE